MCLCSDLQFRPQQILQPNGTEDARSTPQPAEKIGSHFPILQGPAPKLHAGWNMAEQWALIPALASPILKVVEYPMTSLKAVGIMTMASKEASDFRFQ